MSVPAGVPHRTSPKRSRATIASITAVLAVAMPWSVLAAQGVCTDAMTLVECYRAHRVRLDPDFAGAEETLQGTLADLQSGAEDRLRAKIAGMEAAGFSSALTDFLPLLAGSIGMSPVDTDDEGALGFESNIALPAGSGAGQRVRIRATLHRGRLYTPLKEALPEAVRADRAAALEKGFGDFDDVEVGAAWNLESRSYGRTFANHQVVYGRLLNDVLGPVAPGDPAARLTGILLSLAGAGLASCPSEPTVGCIPQARRLEVVGELRALAEADHVFPETARTLLESAGLDHYADLVNNQPQFSAEATIRLRDDLTGPGTFAVGFRFERGFENVNGLRDSCEDNGSAVITVQCLADYLNRPGVEDGLRAGNRLWAAAHFNRVDSYAASLVSDDVQVAFDDSWDLVFEAGYGRYLPVDARGNELGRLDVSVEGRLVDSQAENRENRVVFKLDLSRRVSDGVAVVLGVAAANRPEFIEEDGKKFRIRAGLRYGLQ